MDVSGHSVCVCVFDNGFVKDVPFQYFLPPLSVTISFILSPYFNEWFYSYFTVLMNDLKNEFKGLGLILYGYIIRKSTGLVVKMIKVLEQSHIIKKSKLL